MKDVTHAQASFNRADRLYHGAVKFFFVFAFVMLCVIAFQVADLRGNFTQSRDEAAAQRDEDTAAARKRLEAALKETNRQQIVTQNYVRCIGSVMLKPQAERSTADFDACGVPGVTDPRKLGQPDTNQGSTAPNQQSPAITPAPPTPTTQPSNEPATSGAPPDPNTDDRSALGKLPIIGGLFDAVGL